MLRRKCTYLKRDKQQCQSFARIGNVFCFFHDPETEQQRKAACAAGGRASRSSVRSDVPFFPLRTRSDIRHLNENLAGMLWANAIDAKIANSATLLGNVLLRALNLQEDETRVRDLEALGNFDMPPESNVEPAANRNNEPVVELSAISFRTSDQIIDLLGNAINLVLTEEIDSHIANCIGCVANSQLRVIAKDLEERKKRLVAADENMRLQR